LSSPTSATAQPLAGPPNAVPQPDNGTATASAPPPAPGQPTAPPPPLQLTVPAGSELAIRVNQNISVKHSHAGEHFSGEVVEPVVRGGAVVIPKGTPVVGRIDEAHRRGHLTG